MRRVWVASVVVAIGMGPVAAGAKGIKVRSTSTASAAAKKVDKVEKVEEKAASSGPSFHISPTRSATHQGNAQATPAAPAVPAAAPAAGAPAAGPAAVAAATATAATVAMAVPRTEGPGARRLEEGAEMRKKLEDRAKVDAAAAEEKRRAEEASARAREAARETRRNQIAYTPDRCQIKAVMSDEEIARCR